jgi:hypothetical protein
MVRSLHATLFAAIFLTLAGIGVASPASAAPNPNVSQDVAVCDPYYPLSCAAVGPRDGTDGSTSVTLGNTFQTILAQNKARRSCLLQNPTTATEPLYVYFGVLGSATIAKSFSLAPGMSINCSSPGGAVESRAVNVTAATNAHAFTFVYQ